MKTKAVKCDLRNNTSCTSWLRLLSLSGLCIASSLYGIENKAHPVIFPRDEVKLTPLSRFDTPFGSPHELLVNGDYAYVANGSAIVCIDLKSFEIVSRYLTAKTSLYSFYNEVRFISPAYGQVVFAGMIARASAAPEIFKIYLVDFSNPQSPVRLGEYYLPNREGERGQPRGILGEGRKVYYFTSNELGVLDFTDPQRVKPFVLWENRDISSIRCEEDLMITLEGDKLHFWDISELKNLNEISTLSAKNISDFYVRSDKKSKTLYLTAGNKLTIMDITSPDKPREIGTLELPAAGSQKITSVGEYLYISGPEGGVLEVNIKNPETPILTNKCVLDKNHDFCIVNNHGYLLTSDGICDFDLKEFSHPQKAGFVPLRGETLALARKGDSFYLACKEDKIYRVNLSSGKPQLEKCVSGFAGISKLFAGKGNLYAVMGDRVSILDGNLFTISSFNVVGSIKGLIERGNYLYISVHPAGLHIIDISEVGNPKQIGSCSTKQSLEHEVGNLQIRGDRVYLADGAGGIVRIDVSNPSRPERLGEHLIELDRKKISVSHIVIEGGKLYASGTMEWQGPVLCLFALEGDNLRLRSWSPLAKATSFEVFKNHVFAIEEEYGLRVIKAENDDSLSTVGKYSAPFVLFYDLVVDKDNVYVANSSSLLQINWKELKRQMKTAYTFSPQGTDIALLKSNGQAISPEDLTHSYGQDFQIKVAGEDVTSGAYVGHEGKEGRKRIVYQNLSDKAGWPDIYVRPQTVAVDPELGRFKFADGRKDSTRYLSKALLPMVHFASQMAVDDNYLYVEGGEGWGIACFDISDPYKIVFKAKHGAAWFGRGIAVRGPIVFTDHSDNLDIYDFSNPEEVKVASLGGRVPKGPFGVYLEGNTLYLSAKEWVEVFDVTDPFSPVEKGSYRDKDLPWCRTGAFCVEGGYVYLAEGNLIILDARDPHNIQRKGMVEGKFTGVDLENGYVYLSAERKGLVILDVAESSSPQKVAEFDIRDYAYSIDVEGGYAYLGVNNRACIVDVTDKRSPRLIAVTEKLMNVVRGGYCYNIKAKGNYLYTATYSGGPVCLDITDKTNPRKIAEYYCNAGDYTGVDIAGDYAYVGMNWGGMHIVDISDPSNIKDTGNTRHFGTGCFGPYSDGKFAYYGGWDTHNLYIFDLSNPVSPEMVSKYYLSSATWIKDGGRWTGKSSLSFNGINDYVEIGDEPSLRITNAITIEAWVKIPDRNNYCMIVDKDDGTTDNLAYSLCTVPDTYGGKAYCSLSSDGVNSLFNGVRIMSEREVPTNKWTHITATYDGTYAKIYLDGVEDKSQKGSGGGIYSGNAPLAIGRSMAWSPHFKGLMDEVAIYKRALSAEEVKEHYEIGRPASGEMEEKAKHTAWLDYKNNLCRDPSLVAYYTFEEEGVSKLKNRAVGDPHDAAYVPEEIDGTIISPGLIQDNRSCGSSFSYLLGKYLYLPYMCSIFDMSNPKEPRLVGRLPEPRSQLHTRIWVSGRYAYLANFEHSRDPIGLKVVDVSNPEKPKEIGELAGAYDARSYFGKGMYYGHPYIYVMNHYQLNIIDVSEPSRPRLIGTFDLIGQGGFGSDLVVRGNYAYLANYYGRLDIVDISNPSEPFLVDRNYTGWCYQACNMDRGVVYVAEYYNGLYAFEVPTSSEEPEGEVMVKYNHRD